jgi:hypothetical protein
MKRKLHTLPQCIKKGSGHPSQSSDISMGGWILSCQKSNPRYGHLLPTQSSIYHVCQVLAMYLHTHPFHLSIIALLRHAMVSMFYPLYPFPSMSFHWSHDLPGQRVDPTRAQHLAVDMLGKEIGRQKTTINKALPVPSYSQPNTLV